MTDSIFDEACCRCGAETQLVEDEHMEGLFICRSCLERIEAQNELIAGGFEDEPDVEM